MTHPAGRGELEEQFISELLSAAKVEEYVMRQWPHTSPQQIAVNLEGRLHFRITARWVWGIHQRAISKKPPARG